MEDDLKSKNMGFRKIEWHAPQSVVAVSNLHQVDKRCKGARPKRPLNGSQPFVRPGDVWSQKNKSRMFVSAEDGDLFSGIVLGGATFPFRISHAHACAMG